MNINQQEIIDSALDGLRKGEKIEGSCMYDHGLQSPIVGCSSLRFEGGVFLYKTWHEEPVTPIVEQGIKVQSLDEAGARQVLSLTGCCESSSA